MSTQYGELQPTNGWDRFTSLGHPSKFQRDSRLGFATAETSLNGSQANFARCLAVSWAGRLYIHFRRLLPLTELYQVQNSFCVQVLRSPILAALLHGTRKCMGISQTLRHSAEGAPIFGRVAISLGIGPHSSLSIFCSKAVSSFTVLCYDQTLVNLKLPKVG